MERKIRYQGAIVQDDHILLIRHQDHSSGRDYWLIPGGGRLDGESEEACVVREMKEETNLEVEIVRLILDERQFPGNIYQRAKTYLCQPVGGEAHPGFEPEPEASQWYAIVETGWFDLRNEADWGEKVRRDPITYPLMLKIQSTLGYR
jgi:8-oxo-dGTP pyrophosphatase MutT (NUDIX family)